jgi:hypothetical protein
MSHERRQPTPRKWAAITSRRPVVRWRLQRRITTERSGVSNPLYPFIGAAIAAVVSAYFMTLARVRGERALMWTMGVVAVAFALAALFFGSQM